MVFKILKNNFFIIAVLIIAFRLLTIDIDKPFWGHHDWNSVVYSNIARNYVRYGYLQTKFGQVTNTDWQGSQSFTFLSHYPPLLPILLSFSFKIFGPYEASARLVIVLFSLLLIYSIYLIGKEIHSGLMGLFAASVAIFTPIFAYFGKLPVHDTVVPAISAFGFYLYLKFIKTKNDKHYLALIVSLIIGGLINWSAFYLAISLYVHQLISKSSKDVREKILILIPMCVLLFAIHVVHIKILGIKSANIFSNVLQRADPYLTADLYGFTLPKYIHQELLYLRIYYTLPVFLGAVLFMLYFLFKLKKKALVQADTLIVALLVYGAVQLVVFSNLSFIHDYMIYYLFPFMVLSFAYVTFKLLKFVSRKPIFVIVLVLLVSYSAFDRFQYTKALLETSMNKRGYEAGRLINRQTLSQEKSFITSGSYKEFQEVFIAYYADRVVDYGEILPANFEAKYKLIIRPKDHDPLDQKSKQILDAKFKKFEDENFIWYRI